MSAVDFFLFSTFVCEKYNLKIALHLNLTLF